VIEELPASLRQAVSPFTGIVHAVEECLAATSDPPLFQAACEVDGGAGLLGAPLDHLTGIGGTGRTRREAASAAVGEALERYSATYVPTDRLVTASAAELGDAAVAPERFALFSERQYAQPGFAFRRFDADTRVRWIEGRELSRERPAFLPAELVYLGRATTGDARPVAYSTSSGLACADDEGDAVAAGLFEILERDAFMIVWKNRLSLPLLDISGAGAFDGSASGPFDRTGLDFAAIDLSPFHRLPSVLGVVRAPAGFPGALGVGAAAAPTVEQAWSKALAEAFASRSAAAKLALLHPDRDLGPHGEHVRSFEDHILFYADHGRAAVAGFLGTSSDRTAACSVAPLEGNGSPDRIDALCRRIEAAGSSVYAVDVTSPDVGALGLVVVRVIAPELCALDVPHASRFLGGHRLYEAPVRLGLRSEALDELELNPDPHPFP
jgi:ribosomal protein S12 methylthiotransferase accessory factor